MSRREERSNTTTTTAQIWGCERANRTLQKYSTEPQNKTHFQIQNNYIQPRLLQSSIFCNSNLLKSSASWCLTRTNTAPEWCILSLLTFPFSDRKLCVTAETHQRSSLFFSKLGTCCTQAVTWLLCDMIYEWSLHAHIHTHTHFVIWSMSGPSTLTHTHAHTVIWCAVIVPPHIRSNTWGLAKHQWLYNVLC